MLAHSRQFNTSWQAATPEPNVSRGAFKTFHFLVVESKTIKR